MANLFFTDIYVLNLILCSIKNQRKTYLLTYFLWHLIFKILLIPDCEPTSSVLSKSTICLLLELHKRFLSALFSNPPKMLEKFYTIRDYLMANCSPPFQKGFYFLIVTSSQNYSRKKTYTSKQLHYSICFYTTDS